MAETNTIDTLGYALPREMARVRDEVMPVYQRLADMPGVSCGPTLAIMRAKLDYAAKALAEGDTIEMLRVYEALKECST